MDEKVQMVIETMRMSTRDNEGVIIEPLAVEDGVLRIKYFEGKNEECPECVMPPESFKMMVEELCKVQAPYIMEVEIIPAVPAR